MKHIVGFFSFIILSSGVIAGTPPLDPVLTVFQSGLNAPVGVRNAGDGSDRLFVIERSGTIRIIDSNGNTLPTPFLNISSLVDTFFEGGFLGLAFHPNYQANGLFFVYYTNDNNDTTIARYQVSAGDPNVANAGSALVLLTIYQPQGNHNGGDIQFGPDGYLYIGMGDGGGGGDPCNSGQTIDPADLSNQGTCAADSDFTNNGGNPDSRAFLGTMVRIDVDNPGMNVGDACGEAVNYGIPSDNPFTGVGDDACDEIWAYGLRNPYRFSFDRTTGDMFIADVGQGAIEEVDFQPASSSGGENYGWNCREGSQSFAGCAVPDAIDPITEYTHSQGRCSITGGYRYRGVESTWNGTYIYADFCTNEIFYTQLIGGNWTPTDVLIGSSGSISGFGESEQGRLFLTNFNGQVIEITDDNFAKDFIFTNGFE